ncbi:Leucine-rich_repeat domain superfamily [Hexamita inflata]|uniref:Leucine-rich repeat domain superfamily n=1 Tax=Hexamita inflata TaxID=28002 RepID=A0AA86NYN7_9EUKA|nr:Leucine-rich repeat domain superfamily [Hexamita inflata]
MIANFNKLFSSSVKATPAPVLSNNLDISETNAFSIGNRGYSSLSYISVNVSRNPLASLDGIQSFRNIRQITLTHTKVTSLAPLSGIISLNLGKVGRNRQKAGQHRRHAEGNFGHPGGT